jgi:hypothetical protein
MVHSVNHRLPRIRERARHQDSPVSQPGFAIIDVGLRGDTLDISCQRSTHRTETDVPTDWDGAETPDQAPSRARSATRSPWPSPIAGRWVATELRDLRHRACQQPAHRLDARRDHPPSAPCAWADLHREQATDATVTKEWSFTTHP